MGSVDLVWGGSDGYLPTLQLNYIQSSDAGRSTPNLQGWLFKINTEYEGRTPPCVINKALVTTPKQASPVSRKSAESPPFLTRLTCGLRIDSSAEWRTYAKAIVKGLTGLQCIYGAGDVDLKALANQLWRKCAELCFGCMLARTRPGIKSTKTRKMAMQICHADTCVMQVLILQGWYIDAKYTLLQLDACWPRRMVSEPDIR